MKVIGMVGVVGVLLWLAPGFDSETMAQSRPRQSLPAPEEQAGTPAPAGGAAGSLDLVLAEQIAATAASDLKAALALVPGIVIDDSGGPGGSATLSLRGATAQQVLVLLDGRRLANAQTAVFNVNDLPVPIESIERIEVVPAPVSVLYGADAIGGVVNIVTRRPGLKPGFTLSYGRGEDADQRIAGGLQYGVGKVGLRLDGLKFTGDGFRDNGDFDLKNVAAGLTIAPAPWGLDVRWTTLNREGGVPGPATLPSPQARQKESNEGMRADFTYLAGGGWEVRTGVFSQRQISRFRDPDPPDADPGSPTGAIDNRFENSSHGFDARWNLATGRGELYTFGGEWVTDRIESESAGDHDTDRWGVFAQDQWRAGNWWSVAAIRRDKHSVYGGRTTPSLSIGWGDGGWKLWGAWAQGYRAPTFDDRYRNEQFLQGNPNLKAETSEGYEGGIELEGAGGRLRWSSFRRRVGSLIRWADVDGDLVRRPENVAQARVSGWESEILYRPSPTISIPLGYQRLAVENEETGERLPGSVHSLRRAAIQATRGAFTWSLEYAQTDRGGFEFRTGHWRNELINAALTWKETVGSVPVQVSVRGENLQDRSYETIEGYPQRGSSWFAEVTIGL